jgi:hypothetical protein
MVACIEQRFSSLKTPHVVVAVRLKRAQSSQELRHHRLTDYTVCGRPRGWLRMDYLDMPVHDLHTELHVAQERVAQSSRTVLASPALRRERRQGHLDGHKRRNGV